MKPILLILNLLLFVSLTEVHFSQSLVNGKAKSKVITLGFADTYEKLPKLKFEAITEDEFNKYSSDEFLTNPKVVSKGNYFYIKTDKQSHKFKKYKDYGGKESWNGNELLGFYRNLNLYAITYTYTWDNLSLARLMLFDKSTDYFYEIESSGDGAVELPIPSKTNKYLVYFYNGYVNSVSDIGVLKIGSKTNPKTYLKAFASYQSNDFAVEKIIWIDDSSFVVKSYVEELKDSYFVKKYSYQRTTLGFWCFQKKSICLN